MIPLKPIQGESLQQRLTGPRSLPLKQLRHEDHFKTNNGTIQNYIFQSHTTTPKTPFHNPIHEKEPRKHQETTLRAIQ
jgi:hypothetical protein